MAEAQAKQIELQMKQIELQMKQIDAAIAQAEAQAKAQVELEKIALERERLAMERKAAGMPPAPGDEGFDESQAKEQAEAMQRAALIEAVNNAAAQFAEVAAALRAPKRTKLVTDAAGRPVESVTTPVMVKTARAAACTVASTSPINAIFRRSKRSASAPTTGATIIVGMNSAAATAPSQAADPVSSHVSQPTATRCIHVPITDTKLPAVNIAKFLLARVRRKAANRGTRSISLS